MPHATGRALLIKLFLASPGDVVAERTEAREVVKRVNRTAGRLLGCIIDLYGWEDRSPAYGRPQQQIDVDVDAADVVVGLLRASWGSPTGTHASGFAEEFERAMDRRRSTGTPDILLYFLHAPHGREQPVTHLRAELITGKELLFKELGEHDRLADELSDALTALVLGQSLRELDRLPGTDTEHAPAPVSDHILSPSPTPSGVKGVDPPSSDQPVTEDVELARYKLARAINQLPEREKIAITLTSYEGLTMIELAQVMGVTPGTARRWYRSALREIAARTDLDI
jgi:DNA-directed RNA polymerase specialized sigma24 family protein